MHRPSEIQGLEEQCALRSLSTSFSKGSLKNLRSDEHCVLHRFESEPLWCPPQESKRWIAVSPQRSECQPCGAQPCSEVCVRTPLHWSELQSHGSISSELLGSGSTFLFLFVLQAPGVVAPPRVTSKSNLCSVSLPTPFTLIAYIKLPLLEITNFVSFYSLDPGLCIYLSFSKA